MSTEETRRPGGLYYTVIDGTFRTKVDETHPQAVRREYETKDGAKAFKYERIVTALAGYIEDMGIFEGDYGKTINITLDANADGVNPIVQLNTATVYGEDFLKKLPNIDLTKEVRLAPYSFTDDEGREVRGISVTQDEEKIKNFFYDPEAKTPTNGYPIPDGDTEAYGKEDWKIYFLQARKFLIAYATEQVFPKLHTRPARSEVTPSTVDDVKEVDPDSIPF